MLAPTRQRITRRRSTQLVCALLVGLAVSGQAGALLHQSLVRHAVCAEHGESTHATEGSATPRATTDGAADLALSLPPADDGDEHGHCLFAFTRREAIAHVHAVTGGAPAGDEGALLPRARLAPAHRAIDTLRLAPKSSPPRLA